MPNPHLGNGFVLIVFRKSFLVCFKRTQYRLHRSCSRHRNNGAFFGTHCIREQPGLHLANEYRFQHKQTLSVQFAKSARRGQLFGFMSRQLLRVRRKPGACKIRVVATSQLQSGSTSGSTSGSRSRAPLYVFVLFTESKTAYRVLLSANQSE